MIFSFCIKLDKNYKPTKERKKASLCIYWIINLQGSFLLIINEIILPKNIPATKKPPKNGILRSWNLK